MVHYKSALILICFTLAILTGSEAGVIRRARTLDVAGQISVVTSVVITIQTTIGTVESKIKILTNLDSIASSHVVDISTSLKELNSQLSGILPQIKQLGGQSVNLDQGKLDALKAKVDKLKSLIDYVNAQLNTVTDNTLNLVENKVKAALRLVFDIDESLDKLVSTLLETVSTKLTNLLSVNINLLDSLNEIVVTVTGADLVNVNKALDLVQSIKAKLEKIQDTVKKLTGDNTAQLTAILNDLTNLENNLNLAQEMLDEQGIIKIGTVLSLLGTVLSLLSNILSLVGDLIGSLL